MQGGRDKCLALPVELRDANDQVVTTRKVPLKVTLLYQNLTVVQRQDILKLGDTELAVNNGKAEVSHSVRHPRNLDYNHSVSHSVSHSAGHSVSHSAPELVSEPVAPSHDAWRSTRAHSSTPTFRPLGRLAYYYPLCL